MMNVVCSLCASETDGESLWTTIASRQGPWHGCLKKTLKNLHKSTKFGGVFPYLPAWWQIPSVSSNCIACLHEDQCCLWAASISQRNGRQFFRMILSLHLPSSPDSHFPTSLYPFLHLSPLLLMLSASQQVRLQRRHIAENKRLS